MGHKVYRIMMLAIVLSIAGTVSGYARQQSTVKPAEAPKSTVPTESAEYQELRKKQEELSRQLREVNQKLAEERRKVYEESRKLTEERRKKSDSSRIVAMKAVSLSRYKADTARANRYRSNSYAIAGVNRLTLDSTLRRSIRATTNLSANIGNSIVRSLENLDFRGNFSGSWDSKGDYKGIEKSKTVSKSYPVSAADKLAINNQYGKVTINTWTKNEVKIDIEIKAYHNSDENAQELLDGVTIEDSKQNNLISFKTNITRKKSDSWWGTQKKNGVEERRGLQVNYVVYMPAKSSLDVTNTYGSVTLPDLEGVVKAKVTYGSFTAGKLLNSEVRTSYSPTTIANMQAGTLVTNYGKTIIELANNANVELNYASGSRIGKVINGAEVNLKYSGGFKIDELDSKVNNLIINSSYSGMALKAGDTNFNFDVTVSYAGFNYSNGKVNITSKEPAEGSRRYYTPTQNYKGQYGKGSDSKIVIKSTYGSVQFL